MHKITATELNILSCLAKSKNHRERQHSQIMLNNITQMGLHTILQSETRQAMQVKVKI